MPIKGGRRKTRKQTPRKRVTTRRQVAKIASQVQLNKSETKYIDFDSAVNVDYNGTMTPLLNISQGTTDQTRNGDKITLKNIKMSFFSGLADTYNVVRFIIFVWKGENSTDPTVSDILHSSYIGAGSAPLAPYNHDKRKLFTVKYDKTYLLQGSDNAYRQQRRTISWKSGLPIQFVGASATVTAKNSVYCLRISDSAAVNHPSANITYRLNWKDL